MQIDFFIEQGIRAQNAQRFGEAERAYRAALQIDRTNPRALTLLGTLAGIAGRFQMAIDIFLQALPRDPENADLYHNLGETYRQLGDTGKALPAFNRAIELRPDHFDAYRSAADTAILAAEKSPGAPARELRQIAARYLLALGHKKHAQRLAGVEQILREAASLDPENAAVIGAFGSALQEGNQATEAVEVLRRAIALDPKNQQAYNNLGNAYFMLQRWEEMEATFRSALKLKPDSALVQQNLASTSLMRWLYDDKASPDDVFNHHRAWAREIANELGAASARVPPFANSRDPDRKLRIAYLSGDFRYHAISYFFRPLLSHHDPAEVEVFCYSEVDHPDAVTETLRRYRATWRDAYKLNDEALRAQLRADAIDIVIDLAGHTAKNRLRALAIKAAPVTATWLGYPATTGLSTIDWRITDALADPPGAERFYTEKLMRLPDGFLCYEVLDDDLPEVSPSPALSTGGVTFGSFNNLLKVSSSTIDVWAALLAAVPRSRLLLKAPTLADLGTRGHYLDLFAARGIGAERIEMRGAIAKPSAHLAAYAEVDVALDPFPYNGTTTTCEAMWMGVPVVTLIGDRHTGRVGFDLLTRVGLAELAAPGVDAYIATAAALAQDLPRLQQMRTSLRKRMRESALCDAPGYARGFERALRDMWRQWCKNGEG